MIREDLLEFQYYLERLSKFMQESYGITGQVETFFQLLAEVNRYYDEFFAEMDCFRKGSSGNPEDSHPTIH